MSVFLQTRWLPFLLSAPSLLPIGACMRGGRILWGQIAVVFAIVMVMTWAATQWVAFRLGFQSQLGPPWFDLARSEEHTSELQSLMRISYAVFCLKKKNRQMMKYRQRDKTLRQ